MHVIFCSFFCIVSHDLHITALRIHSDFSLKLCFFTDFVSFSLFQPVRQRRLLSLSYVCAIDNNIMHRIFFLYTLGECINQSKQLKINVCTLLCMFVCVCVVCNMCVSVSMPYLSYQNPLEIFHYYLNTHFLPESIQILIT